jgi:hypothetical protein
MASSSRATRRPERGVRHQAQAFAREVVDDGEDAKAPAIAQRIAEEVHRYRADRRWLNTSRMWLGAKRVEVILAYDVSRWGRLQDTDESAYYEYICRRANLRIEYCAEPFTNDGSEGSRPLNPR